MLRMLHLGCRLSYAGQMVLRVQHLGILQPLGGTHGRCLNAASGRSAGT